MSIRIDVPSNTGARETGEGERRRWQRKNWWEINPMQRIFAPKQKQISIRRSASFTSPQNRWFIVRIFVSVAVLPDHSAPDGSICERHSKRAMLCCCIKLQSAQLASIRVEPQTAVVCNGNRRENNNQQKKKEKWHIIWWENPQTGEPRAPNVWCMPLSKSTKEEKISGKDHDSKLHLNTSENVFRSYAKSTTDILYTHTHSLFNAFVSQTTISNRGGRGAFWQ